MIIFDAFVHWLHIMAAIVWVGGMFFTRFVLAPALQQLEPGVRYPLVKSVGRKFSRIGWIALGVAALSGSYKVYTAWDPEIIFHSVFGAALGVKLTLVLFMVCLSFMHDFVWGPRLADGKLTRGSAEYQAALSRLIFWARVNVALVLVIVFAGVFMRMNPF